MTHAACDPRPSRLPPARRARHVVLALRPLVLLWALLSGACREEQQQLDGALPPPDGGAVLDRGVPQPDITVGPAVTFSLATFNVHNFFDEVDDPAKQDELPTKAVVDLKIKALGKALRELKADILALQEVENKALLDRLNTEELATLGYAHSRLVAGNDPRGINVALLSRFPIPKAISHRYEKFAGVDGDPGSYGWSRDCLEATIELGPGRILVLLVNHLVAAEAADADQRRAAQAAQVRRIADTILKYNPQTNLAVVGDLNDQPSTRTIQLITNQAPPFLDLMTLVPTAERYTALFGGKKEQLDYIIAAPGLKDDLIAGSVQALHTAAFSAASDHFPVIARFILK